MEETYDRELPLKAGERWWLRLRVALQRRMGRMSWSWNCIDGRRSQTSTWSWTWMIDAISERRLGVSQAVPGN